MSNVKSDQEREDELDGTIYELCCNVCGFTRIDNFLWVACPRCPDGKFKVINKFSGGR